MNLSYLIFFVGVKSSYYNKELNIETVRPKWAQAIIVGLAILTSGLIMNRVIMDSESQVVFRVILFFLSYIVYSAFSTFMLKIKR